MRWQWAAVALLAGAAQAQIHERGLTAGYVLDSRTGTLRGIRGIPGATRLGDALRLEQPIAEAAVRNGRAVVITAEEEPRVLLLRRLDSDAPDVTSINTAIGPVNRIYLNAAGTTALLYSSIHESAQFITGLDGTVKVSEPVAGSAFAGKLLDAAIAESSSCALIASSDDENGYLQHVCADSVGQVGMVARLPGVRPAAVGWYRGDRDALVADAAGNALLLLPSFANGTAPVTLAGPNEGIDNPAALLPLNGSTIAIVNRGSASLVLVDGRQGNGARRIELPEVATRLEFLDGSAALACTRVGAGPLMLVDPRRDFAALYVPMN